MMKKCKGCGTFLQSDSIDLEGYTKTQENDLCERCFKITNYNEYQVINKNNNEFIKILEDINKTNDLELIFTCSKEDYYYLKLYKGESLYIKRNLD